MLTDVILDGLRATALVAGLIVAGDAIRSLVGYVPMATGTETQRDVKWLLISLTGAALGDFAIPSFSNALQGIILTAWVSAANTVSVRFQNESGGTLDLASGTLRARVLK